MRKYVAIMLATLLGFAAGCRDEPVEKFNVADDNVANEVTFGGPDESDPIDPDPRSPDETGGPGDEGTVPAPAVDAPERDGSQIPRSADKQLAQREVIQEKRQIRVRKKPKPKEDPSGIEIIRGDDGESRSKPRPKSKKPSIPKLDDDGTIDLFGGSKSGGRDSVADKSERKRRPQAEASDDLMAPFDSIQKRDRRSMSGQERRAAEAMEVVRKQLRGKELGDNRANQLGEMMAKMRKGRSIRPPGLMGGTGPRDHVLEEPEPPREPVEELDGFENRTVQTENIVSKPMTETATDPLSTFSIDVDTGAYTLARARLRDGYLPKAEDVRVEEFLNYFHYDYPQPADGEFAVALEAAPDPFSPADRHLVRIGVQGREVSDAERPPAHLTFLIDVSGSMFGPDKLGLAREALELVTRNLRPDDTVAIVTYAKGADVQMWPAGAKESDIVMANIAALEPGGSSALDEGLKLAYEVAATHYYAGQINRVVVMGDGRANVGDTRPETLLRTVRASVEDGVALSTIGFGAKAFNDRMMERLADNGNGAYYFVDSFREAERVFGDRLCGTLHAIAQDVKIQVEFNPDSVVRHRLVGYENRKLAHREFRDDAVDAGEIGAGHSVTALYEIELTKEPAETLATVRIRHKPPGEDRALEANFELRKNEVQTDVRRASADFKFAAAVALFARVLKNEVTGNPSRMSLIKEIAAEGVPTPDDQPDRAEFLALVDEATPYFVD